MKIPLLLKFDTNCLDECDAAGLCEPSPPLTGQRSEVPVAL